MTKIAWGVLQIAIIFGVMYLFLTEIIKPSERVNGGAVFLIGVGVAFGITWLLSRAVDLIRVHGAICAWIAIPITVGVMLGWFSIRPHTTELSTILFFSLIGFGVFVLSMWIVSKGFLLVRSIHSRRSRHPKRAQPISQERSSLPPVTNKTFSRQAEKDS